MTDDAAGVVEKRDELRLHLARILLHVRSDHGVCLPQLVGVSLGKGQAALALDLRVGLEQLVLFDHTPEGVGGHALALEQTLLDASAVEGRHVVGAPKLAPYLLDGLQHLLGRHFSSFALVRARLGQDGRGAVFLVAAVPGLDGAPGELKAPPVLVEERLLTDLVDARHDGAARRGFDGAEHAHLQVTADSLHVNGILSRRDLRLPRAIGRTRFPYGLPSGVVARLRRAALGALRRDRSRGHERGSARLLRQEPSLDNILKRRKRVSLALAYDQAEVQHELCERLACRAVRWRRVAAQPAPQRALHSVQPPPQPVPARER